MFHENIIIQEQSQPTCPSPSLHDKRIREPQPSPNSFNMHFLALSFRKKNTGGLMRFCQLSKKIQCICITYTSEVPRENFQICRWSMTLPNTPTYRKSKFLFGAILLWPEVSPSSLGRSRSPILAILISVPESWSMILSVARVRFSKFSLTVFIKGSSSTNTHLLGSLSKSCESALLPLAQRKRPTLRLVPR